MKRCFCSCVFGFHRNKGSSQTYIGVWKYTVHRVKGGMPISSKAIKGHKLSHIRSPYSLSVHHRKLRITSAVHLPLVPGSHLAYRSEKVWFLRRWQWLLYPPQLPCGISPTTHVSKDGPLWRQTTGLWMVKWITRPLVRTQWSTQTQPQNTYSWYS